MFVALNSVTVFWPLLGGESSFFADIEPFFRRGSDRGRAKIGHFLSLKVPKKNENRLISYFPQISRSFEISVTETGTVCFSDLPTTSNANTLQLYSRCSWLFTEHTHEVYICTSAIDTRIYEFLCRICLIIRISYISCYYLEYSSCVIIILVLQHLPAHPETPILSEAKAFSCPTAKYRLFLGQYIGFSLAPAAEPKFFGRISYLFIVLRTPEYFLLSKCV